MNFSQQMCFREMCKFYIRIFEMFSLCTLSFLIFQKFFELHVNLEAKLVEVWYTFSTFRRISILVA